jgi:hypothetical protein
MLVLPHVGSVGPGLRFIKLSAEGVIKVSKSPRKAFKGILHSFPQGRFAWRAAKCCMGKVKVSRQGSSCS